MSFLLDGTPYHCYVSKDGEGLSIVQLKGMQFHFSRSGYMPVRMHENQSIDNGDAGNLFAPMPGKVIQILVEEGQRVDYGTTLLVVEAMKMENTIVAPMDAVVSKLNVSTADIVDTKTQLIYLESIQSTNQ